mmetsp:Transcript_482/g.1085  ORF Transcript_482/g.1085 Transcript_482/m.1085 type:complete len:106 (-) Transcript_482:1284-1601(-)
MADYVYVTCGFDRVEEVHQVEELNCRMTRWRLVQHSPYVDEGARSRASEELQNCIDEIYLLEQDCRMEEAERLSRVTRPLLEKRYQAVGVCCLQLLLEVSRLKLR